MHVVIVGCGRSGAALASRLVAEGDTVGVIDAEAGARARLARGFPGRFVVGDGLDRRPLELAGIDRADALVALSSNDTLNLVAATVAREVFKVPHVVSRLNDADLGQVGADLGVAMVASVRMTVDRVQRMLHHRRLEPEHTFGDGESLLVRSSIPAYLAGHRAAEFDVAGEIKVVELSRAGHSTIPDGTLLLKAGDVLTFVVASGSLSRLRDFLGGRWH